MEFILCLIVTDPRVVYVIRGKLINNNLIKLFRDMGCSNPIEDNIIKLLLNVIPGLYGSFHGEPYKQHIIQKI